MSVLKSGELFAGVAGLGRAVDEVFGSEPEWFAEFDAAPSKVLAHHYPNVPNYGDVTKINFRDVPHTHIRCGGFPCTDVSLAGRRAGLKNGTRSGLWSEFRRSIAEDRPEWVVIENVRGLYTADAAGDVEPCPWCLGDGPDEYHLRALDAVLADLSELGFDAEWTGIRASDIGAPHGRFRVFILAWPAERTVADADGRINEPGSARSDQRGLPSGDGSSAGAGESALTLLPTPVAQPSGNTPENPTVGNATGGNAQRGGARGDERLLPGLARDHATDWGPYESAIRRWEQILGRPAPAPVRMDGKGGKARLNAALCEWMMGWPAGWVTDPAIGLSRSEQLKACGNGVVTLQAVAALRHLLSRPGVPALKLETTP